MEYRIGDFSIVTRLSVKTLRYYHECGILLPSRTDEGTGYRWYDDGSLETAQTISKLRQWNFTIEEIAGILKGEKDDLELRSVLEKKLRETNDEIKQQLRISNEIGAILRAQFSDTPATSVLVPEIVFLPECFVAAFRFKGRYRDAGPVFEKLFKLYGRIARGTPFTLYYDSEYQEEQADIEVCLPLKNDGIHPVKDGIRLWTVPETTAVSVIHQGPFEQVGSAYRRIFEFLQHEGKQGGTPFREVYLKGPGMVFPRNPKRFVTRVSVPIISE